MIGLRFPDLKLLNFAVTRSVQQLNEHGIRDSIKKFTDPLKRVIGMQREYIEIM